MRWGWFHIIIGHRDTTFVYSFRTPDILLMLIGLLESLQLELKRLIVERVIRDFVKEAHTTQAFKNEIILGWRHNILVYNRLHIILVIFCL